MLFELPLFPSADTALVWQRSKIRRRLEYRNFGRRWRHSPQATATFLGMPPINPPLSVAEPRSAGQYQLFAGRSENCTQRAGCAAARKACDAGKYHGQAAAYAANSDGSAGPPQFAAVAAAEPILKNSPTSRYRLTGAAGRSFPVAG